MNLSDIEIARSAKKLSIQEIGKKIGINENDLIPYGNDKAKLSDSFIESLHGYNNGKPILVTAVNPTPAGEGKTTTTVGLGDASNAGKKMYVLGSVFRSMFWNERWCSRWRFFSSNLWKI